MIGRLRCFLCSRRNKQLDYESEHIVSCDAVRVICRHPNGEEGSIRWDQLKSVIIETNDTGPRGTDVIWLMIGSDHHVKCWIPGGATGEQDLIEALQRLPGFENESLISAMCSFENKRFVCWAAERMDKA